MTDEIIVRLLVKCSACGDKVYSMIIDDLLHFPKFCKKCGSPMMLELEDHGDDKFK